MSKPDWIKEAISKKNISDKKNSLAIQNLEKNRNEFEELRKKFKKIYNEVVELGLTKYPNDHVDEKGGVGTYPLVFLQDDTSFFIGFTDFLDYPNDPEAGMFFTVGSVDKTVELQCLEFDIQLQTQEGFYSPTQVVKFIDLTEEKIYEIFKVLSDHEKREAWEGPHMKIYHSRMYLYQFYSKEKNKKNESPNVIKKTRKSKEVIIFW